MALSLTGALDILDAHDQDGRMSPTPGKIEVLSKFTRDGVYGEEWETIDLTVQALKDWLGY